MGARTYRASWQHPLRGGGGAGRPGSTMQWSVFRPLHCRAEDRESHLPGPFFLGQLAQDLCFKIFLDHLYQDLLEPLVEDLCIRMLLDHLGQDPLGPLVHNLCIRPLLDHCIGILLDHCIRILWDKLCRVSVSGSLCKVPLDHLCRDPVGALVQDSRSRIFSTGSFWTTCIRML